MKITDEMISKAKGKCTIIDEEYVLLKKSMPVKDDKLEDFIQNMRKARMAGINIASIVDYRLIGDYYHTGYSQGYFLEERAKGNNINKLADNRILIPKDNHSFQKCILEHLNGLEEYIKELLLRASASQEVYDKFLEDYIGLYAYNLVPDPKPLNFFFDPNAGYTIIDPIESDSNINPLEDEYIPSRIGMEIFGYIMPYISIEYDRYTLIPLEYGQILHDAVKTIIEKLAVASRKKGYSETAIQIAIDNNAIRVLTPLNIGLMKKEDMLSFVTEKYNEKLTANKIM